MKNMVYLKEFTKYAGLNVLGMIGLSCYILADTFFVASALGANGLAALNFCISVFSILQGVGLMLGIGGATRYSLFKNSGQPEKADETFAHALGLGALGAGVFLSVGLFGSRGLAALLGAAGPTLLPATTYLKTILCFSPFFLLNNILLAFVRNDRAPRLAMTAMLVSSFSNVVLDYLFMFPLGWGMFGAAFATGLSPIISLGVLSLHFCGGSAQLRLHRCALKLRRCRDILVLGLSALVTELSSAVALIVFNLVILRLEGSIGVAAYGVVANIALVAAAIFTGIGQGLQPLASQSCGAGDQKQVRQVMVMAVAAALLFSAVLYGVVGFWAEPIVGVFNSQGDTQLARLATQGLRIYFVGFFMAGVNIVAAAFFSAVAKPAAGLSLSLLRSCVLLVPAVLVFSFLLQMRGVWLAFVVTEWAVGALSLCFLGRAYRKTGAL